MFNLPSFRRLLLPALILLAVIAFYRSSIRVPTKLPHLPFYRPLSPEGIRVPIRGLPLVNTSSYPSPPRHFFYSHANRPSSLARNGSMTTPSDSHPMLNQHLTELFRCPVQPNRFTGHIRLPHIVRNISNVPTESTVRETRRFWNPTVISLPYWSARQYLLVSRIVTDGNHQQNVLCEADICTPGATGDAEKRCSADDLQRLGPAGGLRCVSELLTLSVPPTPAEQCDGKFGAYVDIPGFHDPRIFWSGKGEPLMMVNTQWVAWLRRQRQLKRQVAICLLWALGRGLAKPSQAAAAPPGIISISAVAGPPDVVRCLDRAHPQSCVGPLPY